MKYWLDRDNPPIRDITLALSGPGRAPVSPHRGKKCLRASAYHAHDVAEI
jgi:hypothetical protein